MHRAVTAALALAAAGCATAAGSARNPIVGAVRTETDTIASQSLGRRVSYNVVLPAGYGSGARYPILWLLHGYGGGEDDWLHLTNLMQEVGRYPFVVVLPAAENSWYVNAPFEKNAAYERFMTTDLYSDVVRRFDVDTSRQAIAGLSMGGYGAVMLGLRHPRRYRFVGGLSAALSVVSTMGQSDSVMWGTTGPSIVRAFGSADSDTKRGYDPLRIFRHTPADSLPYMFLAIGTHDGFPSFLPTNRAFTDSLRAYGARYEYHEVPGTHSWKLWGSELDPMLKSAWDVLNTCSDTAGARRGVLTASTGSCP